MALASDGYAYPHPSSFAASRSPDAAPAIYPERTIRLPKSLKSRLSPEQVSSIVYPPNPPPPHSPILNFNNAQETSPRRQLNSSIPRGHVWSNRNHHHEHTHDHDHCMCLHDTGDSGDEEVEFDHPDYRYYAAQAAMMDGKPVDSVQRRLMEAAKASNDGKMNGAAAGSIASSADEGFENTSNKKKRKIPLSSASGGIHQSRLSAELANMGLNQNHAEADDRSAAYSLEQASYDGAVKGMADAGRGRYARQNVKDGRRPLANTTANTIPAYTGRSMSKDGAGIDGRANDLVASPSSPASLPHSQTLTDRALHTTDATTIPPQTGKENVSLLPNATSSPKTQFTFTCGSDSGSKMQEHLPAPTFTDAQREKYMSYPASPMHRQPAPIGATKGQAATNAQAMYPPRSADPNAARAPQPPAVGHLGPGQPPSHPPPQQQQQPKPRPRRSPSKEYALAARQRKLQQQNTNYHHRPRREDMWICQFCEYEDIFGMAPIALTRAYEIKDRQEQKKAAEKRRLLEKAKQRGRKGKKGANKNNNKGQGVTSTAPPQDQAYDPNGAPIDGDDYFEGDDGYDEDYDPMGPDDEGEYDNEYYPPPPPVPLDHPQSHGVVQQAKVGSAG